MAIYRYKPGSLIEEMRLRTNESGGTRAYLFARADATPEQLQQVRAGVSSLGWKALPIMVDGKPALEVRGFKKFQNAAEGVAKNGWVVGTPSIEAEEDDRRTGKDKFGSSTLKVAGASYVLGDLS